MVATVSGLKFAHEKISISQRESYSVRVVHVDYSWDLSSSIIGKSLKFFDDQIDRTEVNTRNSLRKSLETDLIPEHGTACTAILKTDPSVMLTEHESQVWNLAPFANVYAMPLQMTEGMLIGKDAAMVLNALLGRGNFATNELEKEVEEFEGHWLRGFESQGYRNTLSAFQKAVNLCHDYLSFNNARNSLLSTFDRLINLCHRGELAPGDIIVCPISAQTRGFCPTTGIVKSFDFPIAQFSSVRQRIAKLTTDHSISVILSAGNSGLDLSHGDLPLFFGTIADSSIYRNRGIACGAVITGADLKHSSRATTRAVNTGKCIDASGRYELDNAEKFTHRELKHLANHWSLSSGASMVVAACLASIQQYRINTGYKPLKPYEARAHMRQWTLLPNHRGRGIVNGSGFMGSPPDLEAWMVGTGLVSAEL
ncbi:hypothetical protein [Gymnodinialimonas sp.]